jgi:hypothetical protein
MYFKNYKSSELYILPNLAHLMYIPIISLQFYFLLCGIGITRPFLTSLPLSLASLDARQRRGADPTTIAAAAHPCSDPY